MRFIVRSSDHGQRLPADLVEEKRKEARRRILEAGFQYLEYAAVLGSYDPGGNEIQEDVTVIEATAEANYV